MIRRLPNKSARRPLTGVATAAASRVAVITQDALEAVVSRSRGSSPMRGMTRVCISAAVMPAKARTTTIALGRTGVPGVSGVDVASTAGAEEAVMLCMVH